MLNVACWSQSRKSWRKHSTSISIEYVAIFLILHIQETNQRPSSPSTSYESVWPTHEMDIPSPPSPTSSPIQSRKQLGPLSSHLSPRSPSTAQRSIPTSSSSPQSSITLSPSNKRSSLIHPRSYQSRSFTQNLHLIRGRLGLLLRAVACDEGGGYGCENFKQSDIDSISNDFCVSLRALDSLGFLICGGLSRERQVYSILAYTHKCKNSVFDVAHK